MLGIFLVFSRKSGIMRRLEVTLCCVLKCVGKLSGMTLQMGSEKVLDLILVLFCGYYKNLNLISPFWLQRLFHNSFPYRDSATLLKSII